jgi:hypothetical protein
MKNEWRNIGLAEVHSISTKNTESSKKACLSINGWQFDSSIHSWWDIFDSFTTGDGVGLTDEQESQKGSMSPLELPLPSHHL